MCTKKAELGHSPAPLCELLQATYSATRTIAVEFVEPSFFVSSLPLPPPSHPPPGQEPASADEIVNATTIAAENASFFIAATRSFESDACQMELPSLARAKAKFSTGLWLCILSQRASMTEEGFFAPGKCSLSRARAKPLPASAHSPRQ